MQSAKDQIICRTYVLSDLLALLVAFIVATAITGEVTTGLSLHDILSTRYTIGNIAGFLILVGLWLLVYRRMNLYEVRKPAQYRPHKPFVNLLLDVLAIGAACGMGSIIFAAAGFFFHISLLTPPFFFIFFPCVMLLELALRKATLHSLKSLHLGDRNARNILLVGSNEMTHNYAKMINANSDLGYTLLGFLDDRVFSPRAGGMVYLGELRSFPDLVQKTVVDEVVIVMPMNAHRGEIIKLVNQANSMGISVRFPAAQLFSGVDRRRTYRIRTEAMPGPARAPNLDVVIYSGHQIGWPYLAKRLLDLVVSAILIILTAPIMLVAALLIILIDGRPVLFIQERYGYNHRAFHLFKLRTMVQDADNLQDILRVRNERDGPAFKLRKDPRVTWIGRWLRKASLDELPQLFNILKGEMSLVGPRPLSLSDYARIDGVSQRRRLSVLPGLTGTWQIASGRDKISFDDWMRMDLEYIDHWRLGTDLAVLAKTVFVVLFGKGDR